MTSSSPRLAAADRLLLRSVLVWARANGWRPVQTQYVDRQWSTEAERAPVVCAIRPNYGDNGEDNFGPIEVRIYFFPSGGYRCVQLQKTSTREAVDVLVALGILPAHFSSAFAAGREIGVQEGAAAVTDVTVMSNVQAELDDRFSRMEAASPDLAERLAHLLRADTPYDRRQAMKTIVTEIWEVIDAD